MTKPVPIKEKKLTVFKTKEVPVLIMSLYQKVEKQMCSIYLKELLKYKIELRM